MSFTQAPHKGNKFVLIYRHTERDFLQCRTLRESTAPNSMLQKSRMLRLGQWRSTFGSSSQLLLYAGRLLICLFIDGLRMHRFNSSVLYNSMGCLLRGAVVGSSDSTDDMSGSGVIPAHSNMACVVNIGACMRMANAMASEARASICTSLSPLSNTISVEKMPAS